MKSGKLTKTLFALLAVTAIVAGFYAGRHLIFNKIKLNILERIESSSGLGVKVRNVNCSLLKGACLARVTFYKNNLYEQELFSASQVFVKFPIVKFLRKKPLTPTIAIRGFKCGPISLSGINITATLQRENEIYKITDFKGTALNSSFDFVGEISSEERALSLYGTVKLDLRDLSGFMEGILENSVYFKTGLKDAQNYELGIKSTTDSMKAHGLQFTGVRMDSRVAEGVANVPLFTAGLYGGDLASTMRFDLRNTEIPYQINANLSNLDIEKILDNTTLKGKGIGGELFAELSLEGSARDLDSVRGPGKITVRTANLGPMPLLTPLLGKTYGYLQYALPELKRVNITGGAADFYIKNRRLTTDNLILVGDAIGIYAKGSLDFDGNLDFDVENQFTSEGSGGSDWQSQIQEMIVQVGKLISRARLTGTLKKPKWKFERLGGMENVFKGGLQNLLKDILE